MSWQKMTIGKKIAVGFGVVLSLLTFMGILSFSGVKGIVENAEEVIHGNELQGNLAQKEVDHLNWANKVNALLTDDTVTRLEVQTDHRKCAFGQWLYGEGRTEAEHLVPELAPLFKSIEKPHEQLHASALEIDKVFKQPHSGLALTLSNRLTDHVNWVGQLGQALASEAGGLYSYQSLLKNAVDQAYSVLQSNDNASEGVLETRQNHAVHIIEKLRYGKQGKDYFFIIDRDARMVMHPFKPELNGKDVSGSTDPNGTKLFSEMARICKAKGEGFVTYQWPLPGTNTLAPKLSYFKMYEPWGWIVGTGVYLDHTNHALLARADGFAAGKPFSTGVQLDPTKCAFGRFLADPETHKLAASFPAFKAALAAIDAPHKRLHQTAVQIEEKVNQLGMHAAMKIFNEDTQNSLEEVKTHFQEAIAAEQSLQAGMEAASQIYADVTVPNLSKVQGLLKDIESKAKEHIMTDQVMLKAAQGTERNVTIVGTIAVILGIVLAYFLARGIVGMLTRLSNQLGDGADQVASAASQVSSASQSLAEGASEQAASIEETSSSLEEMSAMTQQNADNARQANGLMTESNQVVDQANASMGDLTRSMQEISQASEETQKIVKTIDEIAFQTNLLALNAAVEAARAGEAGAGFAVVADEVRNLAMRAADAAKNTAELIEGTVKKVGDGSDIVTRTNEAFVKVADSSRKVGDLVGEIAAASGEQAQGIEQVNTAVSEMGQVTQQNAASAEESASASEELSAQAEQMQAMVGELMDMVGGQRHKAAAVKAPKARTTVSSKKTSRELKKVSNAAEQAIPFDGEEAFSDF